MAFLQEKIERESVGRLLQFDYLMDIYNPAVPFVSDGKVVIAGRVEKRLENNSRTVFFRKQGDECFPIADAPTFSLEDPFVSCIGGKLVFGGVEVDRKTGVYRTIFYTGTNVYDLKLLAVGPSGMKDIRIVELIDKTIGIFTRSQGENGGRGKIGFNRVADLQKLNARTILNASLIEDQFGSKRWGGVNQALLLTDGTIGVVGHLAQFGPDEKKHYVAMGFEFDPETRKSTELIIIAERKDFPMTEAKRWDLGDVVFPSGLAFYKDGTAELFAGLSDVAVGCRVIEWPFSHAPLSPTMVI